ncbi:BREX-2 system phosphatase PglZ [Actinomadura hibisca]|uniref:BREX-2 system phosphatase PglZ n=1 Tax=Actinomadura hibisca TaxID=68565 RepID=UPI000A703778|nr:BREX-2 system phosphatase PglZ [Actinomadura hibisca]
MTPPVVDRRVLEAMLDLELPHRQGDGGQAGPRLVLVHGRYRPGAATEFTVRIGDRQRPVTVSDQPSVLGVIDAWESHRLGAAGSDAVLVITTGVDGRLLGADVRGHALGRRPLSVDRAVIVQQRFGAAGLDPRIRQENWLVDALLDAEPADGWRTHPAAAAWRRSGGSVLTRDAAVRALVEARLEITRERRGTAADGAGDLDADTLLAWSRVPGATARFAALVPDERDGIAAWLRQTAGDAAAVLLELAAAGHGADALALGVVGSVLTDPAAPRDAALAVGRMFAGVSAGMEELTVFATAVQGTLTRWISQAETGRPGSEEARERVLAVLRRADELAASAGLAEPLAGDAFLPSGLNARLRTFAAALHGDLAGAEQALGKVQDHRLSGLYGDRCRVAEMAMRLRRWLEEAAAAEIASVAEGVSRHLAEWGWADRALNVVWAGDPARDPIVGDAYRTLYEQASDRRSELDWAFAKRLVPWAAVAAAQAPGGTLPIESVLSDIVLSLAQVTGSAAPLVLVLDGMSASVAAQLGEELVRAGRWTEATPAAGERRAAVSMIPSLTRVSRASLLTGTPTAGGQGVEKAGFAAFWKRYRKTAQLFHKADIPGDAGHRLAQPLADALSEDQVVGVVLNTIDDALDHDREGDRAGWKAADVTFLPDLLNAARDYGRPVVLLSDHGHVLERGAPGVRPSAAPGSGAARWRTGAPDEGEIELAGPRVLEGGGRVVVPWREDIRYTPRKAGYHGGASLAEMTVPILVLLPEGGPLPKGWEVLPPEKTVPAWWHAARPEKETVFSAAPSKPLKKLQSLSPVRLEEDGALFTVGEVAPSAPVPDPAAPPTLGQRVTKSPIYTEQKRYLRKPPDPRQVAAVIDALAETGLTLSATAVAAAAAAAGGRPPRDAEMFVTALQRLLNVEGYPVLELVDAGRTVRLAEDLLREQFGVAER